MYCLGTVCFFIIKFITIIKGKFIQVCRGHFLLLKLNEKFAAKTFVKERERVQGSPGKRGEIGKVENP